MKSPIFYLFSIICVFLVSCNQHDKTKSIDTSQVISEVTNTEKKLYSLLKDGKVDEAFKMHINNSDYRSIRQGEIRNFADLEKLFRDNTAKGIKAYDWKINSRDFIVINETNVLETIQAQRNIISDSNIVTPTGQWVLSTLWEKKGDNWRVAYVHSSTKN